MPADILGTNILSETGVAGSGGRAFTFQSGPVFANIVLADEINRATPKTQSALLEAMQERTVSVANRTMKLPEPFFVLATQNPIEMEGTYPLPEAQMDRFVFKVLVEQPSSEDLYEIVMRTTGTVHPDPQQVAGAGDVIEMIETARSIPVARAVVEYAIRLCQSAHPEALGATALVKRYVRYGPGPRAVQALVTAGKVRALMDNRLNVAFEDIVACAPPALRHRILLNFEGLQARADGTGGRADEGGQVRGNPPVAQKRQLS